MKLKRLTALLLSASLLICSNIPVYAAADPTEQKTISRTKTRQQARAEADTSETLSTSVGITNAAEVIDLSQEQRVEIIGRLCQQDYSESGILASVSAAQCILESGYMGTSLAQEANNCFGMKTNLSDNTWENSAWDGVSTYTKQTWEEYDGTVVTIMADFRKYDSVSDSIADHSAYLLGAKEGGALRYAGLQGETDYKKAIQIIKDGGYATDSAYVTKICSIIEKFDLTQYDSELIAADNDELLKDVHFYRIRKSWADAESQLGAYLDLELAKEACEEGYSVYDWNGDVIYTNDHS